MGGEGGEETEGKGGEEEKDRRIQGVSERRWVSGEECLGPLSNG